MSEEEVTLLLELVSKRCTNKQIARQLKTTPEIIKHKLYRELKVTRPAAEKAKAFQLWITLKMLESLRPKAKNMGITINQYIIMLIENDV